MSLCTLRNKKFATPIAILLMAAFSLSLYTLTTNYTPAKASEGGVSGEIADGDADGDGDAGTLEIHMEYDLEDVVDAIAWLASLVTDIFTSDNNTDNNSSECECGCGVDGCSC